jgi:carboxyl-terminal processing protease
VKSHSDTKQKKYNYEDFMIKLTYAIYGMNSDADQLRLQESLSAEYPTMQISVSYPCATLSVTREGEGSVEFDEQLHSFCEKLGFSLQIPAVATKHVTARKTPKKVHAGVPVSVFIASLCAVLVFSILLTYTAAASMFNNKLRDWYLSGGGDTIISGSVGDSDYDDLDILREIFAAYSVHDLNDEEMVTAVLKSYVAATGDVYAAYYTKEELDELFTDDSGEMVGIGVSVVNTKVPVNGWDYNLMTVITAYKNSPAIEAGIQPGDIIYSLINDEGETVYVDSVGQTQAINMIRGLEGSDVTLTILRPQGNDEYEVIDVTMTRRKIEMHSVEYRISHADATIGIVEISEFDMTTPPQFREAMDALIAQGCDKFIFDLRNNGGGDLQSIEAVLSTMLQPGDPMIYTVDKAGNEEVDVVRAVEHQGYFESCSVKPEHIGKYRGYDMVVLTNEYTASAAELFTANLRDYNIATQVGVTTFGKGCMQTILDLSYFGIEGGLRLTTAWYLPPCKESYHDIGIAPAEENQIALDESLFDKYHNVYLIPDEEDNQLNAAIDRLLAK